MGLFDAPASAGHHLNVKGGLVLHSLNTCKAALKVWEGMKQLEPTLEREVPRDSVILASLLHDVCKPTFTSPPPSASAMPWVCTRTCRVTM